MKMKLKDVENAILDQLGTHVEKHGFKAKPTSQSFCREIPGACWVLHISFIRHKADIDMTADVAVRINAIEQIVNQFDTGMTKAEKRTSMTLGAELGNISGHEPLRWTAANPDDIPLVVGSIVRKFEEIGLPYFSTYSDMEAVYRLLASNDPEDHVHSPILGARCMRAIAAAHLLGRSSELKELSHRCDAQLAEEDDLYLSDFRALRDSLETP